MLKVQPAQNGWFHRDCKRTGALGGRNHSRGVPATLRFKAFVPSGPDSWSNNNPVQVRRVASWIAYINGVDTGVQPDWENDWHGIIEGGAVQVEFLGGSPVYAQEIRAWSAGLVVDLQLIRAVCGDCHVGESNGIGGASTHIARLRKTRGVVAEPRCHAAAKRRYFRFVGRRSGRREIPVPADNDAIKIRRIARRVAKLDAVQAFHQMNRDGGACGKQEASAAAVKGLEGAIVHRVQVRTKPNGHGIDLHEVLAIAWRIDVIEGDGVTGTDAEISNFRST